MDDDCSAAVWQEQDKRLSKRLLSERRGMKEEDGSMCSPQICMHTGVQQTSRLIDQFIVRREGNAISTRSDGRGVRNQTTTLLATAREG